MESPASAAELRKRLRDVGALGRQGNVWLLHGFVILPGALDEDVSSTVHRACQWVC